MRGGALRIYRPQMGRGLGGILKRGISYVGKNVIMPYVRRGIKRKRAQVTAAIKRKVGRMIRRQTGGALKRRRKRKRRGRKDIFTY